jgi:hypothetical protein
MKILIWALGCILVLSACTQSWDQENQDLFVQACLESARENQMEEAEARSMCTCRLETIMKKYPSFADAMGNLEKILEDEEVKACK